MNKRVCTHIEQRRSSSRILKDRHVGVCLPTDGSSCEYVLVARVLVLPIIPNLIDHLQGEYVGPLLDRNVDRTNRVVKEEHRIYFEGPKGLISGQNQSTAAWLTIRRPLLARDAFGRPRSKRTRSSHIPSQDKMRPRVGSVQALDSCLEVNIIPWGRV